MAEVIPLDGSRPRRRRAASSAGDALAAGAARAGGERARRQRRTTPLLAGLESVDGGNAGPNATEPNGVVEERAARREAVRREAEQRQADRTVPVRRATPAAKAASPKSPAAKAAAASPGRRGAPSVPGRKGPPPPLPRRSGPPPPPKRKGPPPPPPRRVGPSVAVGADDDTTVGPTPGGAFGPTGSGPEGSDPGAPDPASFDLGAAAAASAESLGALLGDKDRVAEIVGTAAQVGGWIAEILAANLAPALAEQKLASVLEFLTRRLTGDYQVDEFGFDPLLTDSVLLALARPLYRRWFRVEVRGIENIPSTGGALVVANHSGAVAIDSLMTSVAVHDEHPQHRFLRMLGADLVFNTPVISQLARKGGATLASNADAERLLSGGEVVGVWPEGFKGIGKPFSERYKLQRFGRGGFVSAALRTRTPIIPCSIVGAEEIYPIIGNLPSVARLLGLPYLPITPTFPWLGPLGAIPLPSKWLIEFGEPVPTDSLGEGAQDDPMLVFDLTDQVRQTIQQTLYTLLMQRRSIFY